MKRQDPKAGSLNKTLGVGAVVVLAAWLLFSNILPSPGPKDGSAPAKGKGYTLAFPEDFNRALAARDDLGISVVIAVDISGSMADPPRAGGEAKYVQAAGALAEVARVIERIAKSAPPGLVIKAGILKFNEAVTPVLELTTLDAAGLARFKAVVADPENFLPGGKTAIGAAIEGGIARLAQSGTILRSLVVITDGANTEGTEPAPVLEAVYANRNSASGEGYTVSTSTNLVSFVGFDVDSGLFGPLSALGARVTSAADRTELSKVVSSILEADITKLEAPSLGGAKQ